MSNFIPYNYPSNSTHISQTGYPDNGAQLYRTSEASPPKSLFQIANENFAQASTANSRSNALKMRAPAPMHPYEPPRVLSQYTPTSLHPPPGPFEARSKYLPTISAPPLSQAQHIPATSPLLPSTLPAVNSELVDPSNKKRAQTDGTDAPDNPPKRARGKAAEIAARPKVEKENVRPPPSQSTAAKKAAGYVDGVTDGTRWTIEERGRLYDYILGPDSDKTFKRLAKNPKWVFEKAIPVLDSKFTEASIKGQWTRSLKTYNWILAFEGFTGNGGGDADADDDDDILAQSTAKLERARAAGISVGTLTAKTVDEWNSNGWYNLFSSRFKSNPAISTEHIRHSAMPISDSDEDAVGSSSDTITSNNPPTSARKSPKTHSAARGFRDAASSSLNTVSALLTDKRESEGRKVALFEKRLELDVKREEREAALEAKREEREAAKHRMEMATKVLAMDNVEPDVREAANNYLKSLFAI